VCGTIPPSRGGAAGEAGGLVDEAGMCARPGPRRLGRT